MKRLRTALILVMAGLISLGAECDSSPPCAASGSATSVHEEFDEICDGVPCGWEIVGGSDGTAETTTTIHAGENGIALRGEDLIVGKLEAGSVQTFGSTDVTVQISARCDSSSFLIVGAKFHDGEELVGVYDVSIHPLSTWQSATFIQMNPELALPADAFSGERFDVSLILQKEGSGSCEVDSISMAVGFGLSFCE